MTAWLSFWGVSFLFPFLLGFTAWIWKWSHDSICFSTQSFLFLPVCACLFPFICPALPFLRYFFFTVWTMGVASLVSVLNNDVYGRRSLFLFLYSDIFFSFFLFPPPLFLWHHLPRGRYRLIWDFHLRLRTKSPSNLKKYILISFAGMQFGPEYYYISLNKVGISFQMLSSRCYLPILNSIFASSIGWPR